MPSLIGLIMLMGIATKNSILLVEYAIVARRDHGMARLDALLDACHKRARPIIMTTIAMGAGMMPIALGLGADAELPLADGDRRDRRPDHLDGAEPAGGAGRLHLRLSGAGMAEADHRAEAAAAGTTSADRTRTGTRPQYEPSPIRQRASG